MKALSIIRYLFLGVLVTYAILFAWFYQKNGLRIVGWHTHLLYPAYMATLVYLLFKKVIEPVRKRNYTPLMLKWLFIVWLIWVVEIFLLARGNNGDLPNGYYPAPYESKNASYYHVWPENSLHVLQTPEYSYNRSTNSLGFSDREWNIQKDSGTIRILCFGDSFTEGDGAHQDSTYVSFLKRILDKSGNEYEVLNAGTCGSDPFFNFINLKDRLLHYQPDIVIQAISSNDIYTDLAVRGGLERFREDGKLIYLDPPWWEPLFASSLFFRKLMINKGYDFNMISGNHHRNETYLAKYQQLFQEYEELCLINDIRLIIAQFPSKPEFRDRKYYFPFDDLKRGRDAEWADLLQCMESQTAQKGLQASDLYWVVDGHFNAKGYEIMAECIARRIEGSIIAE